MNAQLSEPEPIQDEKTLTKSERIKKEGKELYDNAISGRITNIRERVAFLLNNFPEARNSDIDLTWLYWGTFEQRLFNGYSVTREDLRLLTKMNSLIRIRAKIQNEYKLFQASDDVKKFRGVLGDEKKQEVVEDKPLPPFYTIYMDESGKTGDYLSVGSLWITDTRESVFSFFKLKDWVAKNSITSEFHFVKVRDHNLESYKAFFLEFLVLYPSVGFKVIIVDKIGIKNENSAITDLTFHLINQGVQHENVSGRAPLPRVLQVFIDEEQPGIDQIKIENIKERIQSQKIDGLGIHSFKALVSKDEIYLQVVDLFVSSVNRRMNPSEARNAKDELADYILNLLKFDISKVDKANNQVDKSMAIDLSYKKPWKAIKNMYYACIYSPLYDAQRKLSQNRCSAIRHWTCKSEKKVDSRPNNLFRALQHIPLVILQTNQI